MYIPGIVGYVYAMMGHSILRLCVFVLVSGFVAESVYTDACFSGRS